MPLIPTIEAFEDKSALMGISEISQHGNFTSQQKLLRPGFTSSAIWLKLTLTNTASAQITRWISIQPTRLEKVDFFTRKDNQWQHLSAGNHQPFSTWPISAVNSVFPIQLAPLDTQSVYIRVSSNTRIMIIPELWDPAAFQALENHIRLVDGLILGGLFAMVLMSILLLSLLRDRAFLFNALATLTYCLGEASAKGYSFMYLWPDATLWATKCLPLFAMLGVGLNILFLRDLLSTRKIFPKIDNLLLTLLTIQWLPVFGILFGTSHIWAEMSFLVKFPATLALLLTGVYAVLKGIHAARYYTAAYTVLAIGSLSHALALQGVSSIFRHSEYTLPIAMLLSNTLIMISVVDRFINMRREKYAAQQALLTAHAEHEALLEKKIKARTADLDTALTETRLEKQTQSRLVAYIGHDLRAPLATIVNYVKLLGHRDDERSRHHQATIERCANQQLELIDDLVEYARGELNHLELVLTPTYLHDWLKDIANQAELLAIQYNNRFELKLSGEIPPVAIFDPKRLRQVLINLLQNSAKFTSEGEISLVLHATPSSDSKVEIAFAVKDTGAGIPQEDMERIFLPFEQRKSEREGSGLGLTIARKLVRAMGSDLTAESTSGKGSSFNFLLSIKTTEEAHVQHLMQAFTYPEPFGTGKTLLIADDNAASRDYLHEVLATANYETICVPNGTEALHLAQTHRFDAILIDQLMPDMSGWEVLSKLHESSTSTVPPFILCSAMLPIRPEGFPAGINFHTNLLKPVNADNLLQTIQSLLGETPPSTKKIQTTIPNIMLNPLRDLIANGCITDIETWVTSLKRNYPEHADFFHRIQDATRQCDLTMLTNLVDMHTDSNKITSKKSLLASPINTAPIPN